MGCGNRLCVRDGEKASEGEKGGQGWKQKGIRLQCLWCRVTVCVRVLHSGENARKAARERKVEDLVSRVREREGKRGRGSGKERQRKIS